MKEDSQDLVFRSRPDAGQLPHETDSQSSCAERPPAALLASPACSLCERWCASQSWEEIAGER